MKSIIKAPIIMFILMRIMLCVEIEYGIACIEDVSSNIIVEKDVDYETVYSGGSINYLKLNYNFCWKYNVKSIKMLIMLFFLLFARIFLS